MKATVLFVLVFAFTFAAFGQAPAPQADELATYIKENYTKREVQIPMRDGVKLFTSIYEPKDQSQKYPIMMSRTPYSVAPYGPDKFKTSLGPDYQFAREGYIFVYQDVRGRWMSEGTFVDVRPEVAQYGKAKIDESTDTFDTIDWLIKNVPNNNGKVGTYGISYPGFYTSAGSINSHPALKACSPQAPVSDWFHGDDMHHNGALFLAQNYSFYRFFQPFTTPSNSFSYLRPWKGRDTQDGYDFFMKLGGLQEVADSFVAGLGVRQPYWDDMQDHPNYDQYWKDRNVLPHLNKVGCATMTVGGWYDNEDLYGALNTYRHIEKQNPGIYNILVVGPWFHGGWARSEGEWLGTAYFGSETSEYYRVNMELPFFNHFLKGKGDISQLKEVNVFDTGANTWRSFDGFDPASGKDTALYFTKGGGLSFTKGTDVGYDEYVSDPMKPVPYTQKITLSYPRDYMTEDQRFASTRPDVLVYETAPLTEDVTVAGDIKPSLYISSSGTDSDFIVKLIDVFPDDYKFPKGKNPPQNSAFSVFEPGGYQMLLRGEPMPARFREGFEKGIPLVPNKATYLPFTMPGITHTFKKGHRIMVQIQSTWFPLVARSPQQFVENNFKATSADFRKATQRVYFGGETGSAIVLPIVK
ncbi:MAG: CocE/NonD family hydrolase [Acidobacteria bacterium ACB1]|nr:Cocaine esterase [Pyrinomonadaceae bacterium]MCE7961824.1 CocE/NonD family hydrolase [Acidobacteria bacterium ACB1]RIJ91065.1 MAG: X-Pro dipeptidyl-peptidase [Acidobacteriota bacterium]